MIEKASLEKLEFSKILQYIANYSQTENGKQLILSHCASQLIYLTIEKEGEISDPGKRNIN